MRTAFIHESCFGQHDLTILDPTASPLRLWPLEIPVHTRRSGTLLYLLAESLRQLQMERYVAVRYCADALEPTTAGILQRLGFRLRQNGMRFSQARRLNSPISKARRICVSGKSTKDDSGGIRCRLLGSPIHILTSLVTISGKPGSMQFD